MTGTEHPMAPNDKTLPRLTHDLPGTGGRIKEQPDDFIVEEIPLYLPSGEGTHLFLLIEKRNVTTFRAIQLLARRLGRNQREFGVAGLKDAAAVTRQYVSIEHVAPEEVDGLDLPGIKVVDRTMHRNKLKRGHLKGNRFSVVIRDPFAGSEERARAVLDGVGEADGPCPARGSQLLRSTEVWCSQEHSPPGQGSSSRGLSRFCRRADRRAA